ncbi:hypothetical protein OU995_21665 [Roseateles sp. SL47]|uniref:hypothetical protein n=1 Tax=Roseateles sp. SL47 TaxID=2995138 RepID=UPI00226E2D70|nr:hypothetical protein [Roseateles sp. SL47]WAC72144.1 hypothetical protein OU995_21665 [Roseateles sp. SL47]
MRSSLEHLYSQLQEAANPSGASRSTRATDSTARRFAAEQRAAFLSRHTSPARAVAGSSEVRLIQPGHQSVLFAFKPFDGESPQNLLPRGGSGLREKLCDDFNQRVSETTGLNFGFPHVNIVSNQGQLGALIDGVPGQCMDVDAISQQVEPSEEGLEQLQRTRALWALQAQRLEPTQLQQAMLANLAMGNLDIKWGNLMIDIKGGVRPIDGGSAFPNRLALAQTCQMQRVPNALCSDPSGTNPLPAADLPFDPWLRERFLAIDADQMQTMLMAKRQQLLSELPKDFFLQNKVGNADLVLDEASVQAGVDSLRRTQQILREDPDCSMRTLADRYAARLQDSVPAADVRAYGEAMQQFSPTAKLNAFRQAFERAAAIEAS